MSNLRALFALALVLLLTGCSDNSPASGNGQGDLSDASGDSSPSDRADVPPEDVDMADNDGGSGDAPGDLPEDVPPNDVPIDVPAPVISELYVVENPRNTLSFYIEWETDVPTQTKAHVICGDDFEQRYSGRAWVTSHSVFVMGLLEGMDCEVTAEATVGTQTVYDTGTFEDAGPVPEFLPDMVPSVIDLDRMQLGWTLWTHGRSSQSGPVYVIITDEQGRYRWYSYESTDRRYPDNEVMVVSEGILLGNASTKIINWEGEVVWEPTFHSHHDLVVSPFRDNHYLYIGNSGVGCSTPEGTANEYNRTTDQTIWTWRLCDHFTPRKDYRNWSHLNAIEPYDDEPAFLLSPRDQNCIIKVNRDTGDIEWILGEQGDFEMDSEDRFLRQHAVELQPNGNVLLFDNGLEPGEASWAGDGIEAAREYSRVLEFELTFDLAGNPDRADVVWHYTDEDLFSASRSEADRLTNGNTLILYSWVNPDRNSIIREVTHEGDIVYELAAPPDRSSYRLERIEPYFGHVHTP